MKRKYTLIAGLLIFVFSVSQLFAVTRTFTDEDIAALIAGAPNADRYPQAAGYTLVNQRATIAHADGSSTTDWLYVVKILAERGKESLGDVKYKYDKDSDSVVVVKAVTHKADGSVMAVEAKAIHDLTPAGLANAAIYSNIMQKVVNFPAMATGVTIELHLRVFHKASASDDERFYWGAELFQSTDPIGFKEVSLTVPQDVAIRYTYQNEGVDYTTSTQDGAITHNWTVENAAQIINEPQMPDLTRIAPRVIYTNADSWEQVGRWVGKKFYAHVKTDGDVAKKAAELTKAAKSDDEKIEKIGLFVIKDIRSVAENSLPLGLAGYEPNDADLVLANKYGDWRDKSVLLVSLLRSAGITCYPHYISRSDAVLANDYPAMKQFDAVYVYVSSYKGAPLWINPFGSDAGFGYFPSGQGTSGLLVKEDAGELLAVSDLPAEKNQADCRFEMLVQANGDVQGSAGCQLSGIFDNMARLRLKDATPKEREQYFLATANDMGEGSLNRSYKVSELSDLMKTVQVAQDYWTPEFGIVQGDMMIFRLKDIPFSFAQISAAPGQTYRNYSLMIDDQMTVKKDGVVHLPAGYKAVYVAQPLKIENAFGLWESHMSLNADSTEVYYNGLIKLSDTEIDTDEYPEFKKAYDDYSSPKNYLILLEKRQ